MDPYIIMLSVVYYGKLDDRSFKKLRNDKHFLNKVLRLVEINGLYYFFVLRLKEFGLDLTKDDRFGYELQKLEDFERTLDLLNEISRTTQIDHIIIKSCIDIPHVPRDVDVLIHSGEKGKFIKALEDHGLKTVYCTDVETSLGKDKYMKVDIYTGTKYLTFNFLDESFLWKSFIHKEIFGKEHLMLNNEANLLLLLAHSVYGHRSMTFLDFLQIDHILSNSNISLCEQFAAENKWLETFQMIMAEFKKVQSGVNSGHENDLSFPYKFKPYFVLKSVEGLNDLDLSRKMLIFLYFSFIIDGLLYEFKKHEIFDGLVKYNFVKTSFNSFNYFIRHACGDTKSK